MIFSETAVRGAFLIDLEEYSDERGSFARTFCQREFETHGLTPAVSQCSISTNRAKGTLRGMHSQASPHEEDKLVRCTRGSIYDAIVDLRRSSSSYLRCLGVILSAENRRALYIPKGVFHGFLTLEDDTDVYYQMSGPHSPAHARGVRWNDAAFGIEWPIEVVVISERDANYPDFDPGEVFAT